MTAVCLRRWFRSPPLCSFSSLVQSQRCFCALGRRPPLWQDVALCSWWMMGQLSALGQILTPVSSTHPVRRCWKWALYNTATAPNCSCSLSPIPPAFGDLASMPKGHNSHISNSAQLQGMRCPCPSAFLLLLPQAVQSSSSQDLLCYPSLTA